MTSENHTTHEGTGTSRPVRRRMGGQEPMLPQTPTAGSETTATNPPVRKTRMGAAATSADTTVKVAEPQESVAPTRKTRMGATSSSVTPTQVAHSVPTRTRMGSPATPAATPAMTATTSATAPPIKRQNRMGAVAGAPDATDSAPAGTAETPHVASAPVQPGQPGRPAWVRPVAIIAVLMVVGLVVVLGARWLRTLEVVQEFIVAYDGHASQPETAPVGIPGWLGWQHFLNMFFIVLIIRTGLAVRTERKPPAYWTAKKNSFFSPAGNTPKKVSLSQWLHQALDVLWVINGLIFIVLLVATGHWMRIVPMSWDIFPNMLSGMIQYASLDWPTENGWVHYNALQVMAYFVTVFIAAPLAVISGLRFSTWWPEKAERLTALYPVEWARAIHFPVMLYFLGFTIVHVFLVFFTGALVNLNHMYTSRDVADWWGLIIFLISVAVIAGAWFLSKPLFITPIARKTGAVTKN